MGRSTSSSCFKIITCASDADDLESSSKVMNNLFDFLDSELSCLDAEKMSETSQ